MYPEYMKKACLIYIPVGVRDIFYKCLNFKQTSHLSQTGWRSHWNQHNDLDLRNFICPSSRFSSGLSEQGQKR